MLYFALLAGKSRTLSVDLGMAAAYTSTQAGSAVQLMLRFTPAGTWLFTVGAGDTLGGTPTSGTWGDAASAGTTKIRYTVSGIVGGGGISNGASSFTDLTANRDLDFTDLSANTSATVLIELQEDGGGDFVSETISMAANGA